MEYMPLARKLVTCQYQMIDAPMLHDTARQMRVGVRELRASFDEAARDINNAIRFDVNNILPQFFGGDEINHGFDVFGFEGGRPPWPKTWMECLATDVRIVSVRTGKESISAAHMGVLVTETSPETWEGLQGEGGKSALLVPRGDEMFYELMMWSWPVKAPIPQGPITVGGVTLDAQGKIAIGLDGQPKIGINILAAGAVEVGHEEAMSLHRSQYFFGLTFPLRCFRFANCRNVEVVEVQPRPINRQQRRQWERKPEPLIVHKVLAIKGKDKRRVAVLDSEQAHEAMHRRMHICRGHFATYTDAAPLFGRLTGRFWRPMHTRGSMDAGVVDKGYQAVP